jgi:hypothetical protein
MVQGRGRRHHLTAHGTEKGQTGEGEERKDGDPSETLRMRFVGLSPPHLCTG